MFGFIKLRHLMVGLSFPGQSLQLACFGVLDNGPMLVADHVNHMNWTESAVNLAVTGAAWVVADSLARHRNILVPGNA